MIKMYCIFSAEAIKLMKGNRGKMAAQAGHAYLHSWWDADRRFSSYEGGLGGDFIAYPKAYKCSDRAYKICLVVDNEEKLKELHDNYRPKCGVALIEDAGFTVFERPTVTCLGLGPVHVDDLEDDIKSLKVLI